MRREAYEIKMHDGWEMKRKKIIKWERWEGFLQLMVEVIKDVGRFSNLANLELYPRDTDSSIDKYISSLGTCVRKKIHLRVPRIHPHTSQSKSSCL